MKRMVVILILFGAAGAARADGAVDQAKADQVKAAQVKVINAATTGYTSGGASVASDVIQAAAQVVLKRATRAAWDELASRLSELIGCPTTLVATCKALATVRIQDILASPTLLLDAFVGDVLSLLKLPPIPVRSLLVAWSQGRLDSVVAQIMAKVYAGLRAQATVETCSEIKPPNAGDIAVWALSRCLTQNDDPRSLLTCNVDELLSPCDPAVTDPIKDSIKAMIITASDVFGTNNAKKPAAAIRMFFEWQTLFDPSNAAKYAAIETVFLGLANHDWLSALSGLGAVSDVVATQKCTAGSPCPTVAKKLLALMGAVGELAQRSQPPSTGNTTDAATAAAAREKVIEDLADSMVDRTDREHGAVVSLGGSLGLYGGRRFNQSGGASQWSFPARLTLGVGVQTYSSIKLGFHVELDAFDLGQYITYSQGDLQVAAPDVKSVIVAGASVGFWFLSRNTPLFAAAHASASPFVRTTDGHPTYELGVLVGMYVPLFDLN